ncbi:NAD(P)H-hydrate epimerase [uncultured Corynebacterium sp.]|uniref:NAD(P)H-hydrate epimerase n=1 Tax=uncultured Corynebacterium sp. TaxID=159447 RepID=UPI0025FE88DB|nr:NAD(P)H-hydrate epimerase [uncultured Corynebacterium sp.]
MPYIVPTSRVTAALEQVPAAPPKPGDHQAGWVIDDQLVERLENFGPLRQGVHDMAAVAIADVAEAMLAGPLCAGGRKRILLLAGPGGNGADGLRVGRVLAMRGHKVDIMVLLPDQRGYSLDYPEGHENKPLLAELVAVGGNIITGAQIIEEAIDHWHGLIIEAMVGSGFEGVLTDLMAAWAEISTGIPSLAVDVPAGVVADTGELPLLNGESVRQTAFPGGYRHPPTVTLALGALRAVHATDHCGAVLLASCGLEVEHDYHSSFSRLIAPDLGFIIPATTNTMLEDAGRSLTTDLKYVHPQSVGVVIGELDCVGFGDLALQGLRGIATWHHLTLVAESSSTTHLVAQHPDVEMHTDISTAMSTPPNAWIVETRDVEVLRDVLKHEEQVVLGPRAADTLRQADLLGLIQERSADTIVFPHKQAADEFMDALGAWATVVQLGDGMIHISYPDVFNPGSCSYRHFDPVVPLGKVQGIEAVLAGLCAVSHPYMALALSCQRMRKLQSHWPIRATDIAQQRP